MSPEFDPSSAGPDIRVEIQRELLRLATRNAAGSVVLLLVAVGCIAWMAWFQKQVNTALAVLVLGGVVAGWRLAIHRGRGDLRQASAERLNTLVRQLEANSLAVGLIWAATSIGLYPQLEGSLAIVYIGMVCGSMATASHFMPMAGRSFAILTVMQMTGIVIASLLPGPVSSIPMALLAIAFGWTMIREGRAYRDTAIMAIRHAHEADQANRSLQRSAEAAEAANLAKSQFLATMSHEIRTPMNGVLGALELLRQTTLDTRQRRLVKTAFSSGESLMDILNDVLDHSKIEAGKLSILPSPMSLHTVAQHATQLFRANAEARELTLVLALDERNVPDGVIGDAPRLKQVLLNLLGNGVKFTERGSVTLALKALDGATPGHCRIRFEVADTGIGIPPEALAQVFQPFHQVDSTRSRLRGGTGLGLAISQRIVQAMGGSIVADSQIGRGSVFRFELEFELAPHLRPADTDSGFGALPQADGLAGTVLLVEDNEVNRMIGAEMLKSFGLEVLQAEDGAQGMRTLNQHHVDLVLMDISMPVLDGYAATRQARDREQRLRLPRVPIVALTANAFDEDAAAALAAGMDAHLAKPYSREQLRQLLARWL